MKYIFLFTHFICCHTVLYFANSRMKMDTSWIASTLPKLTLQGTIKHVTRGILLNFFSLPALQLRLIPTCLLMILRWCLDSSELEMKYEIKNLCPVHNKNAERECDGNSVIVLAWRTKMNPVGIWGSCRNLRVKNESCISPRRSSGDFI